MEVHWLGFAKITENKIFVFVYVPMRSMQPLRWFCEKIRPFYTFLHVPEARANFVLFGVVLSSLATATFWTPSKLFTQQSTIFHHFIKISGWSSHLVFWLCNAKRNWRPEFNSRSNHWFHFVFLYVLPHQTRPFASKVNSPYTFLCVPVCTTQYIMKFIYVSMRSNP